jgi:co-chaperonin GroES (HSP10)
MSEHEHDHEQKKRPLRKPTLPGIVTAENLAGKLGVAKATIYALAKQRDDCGRPKIPSIRIGDRVLFNLEKVIAALETPAEDGSITDGTLPIAGKGRRQKAANE